MDKVNKKITSCTHPISNLAVQLNTHHTRVPVVRIDSHRFENNFMNREAVRSGSVPLRFVSRPVHGFIRFHSVRFLSGIDCVIAFNKGSVCGNVYSSIQTISVGVRNFLKAMAFKIAETGKYGKLVLPNSFGFENLCCNGKIEQIL